MVDRPHHGSRALTHEDHTGVSRFLTALTTPLPRVSVAPMSSRLAFAAARVASITQRINHGTLSQLLADRAKGDLRMSP